MKRPASWVPAAGEVRDRRAPRALARLHRCPAGARPIDRKPVDHRAAQPADTGVIFRCPWTSCIFKGPLHRKSAATASRSRRLSHRCLPEHRHMEYGSGYQTAVGHGHLHWHLKYDPLLRRSGRCPRRVRGVTGAGKSQLSALVGFATVLLGGPCVSRRQPRSGRSWTGDAWGASISVLKPRNRRPSSVPGPRPHQGRSAQTTLRNHQPTS
jgi:hypothetical protein